ncbi:glycosyltransferase [Fischerella sp. PCC 9605]|uniref:glycosyltransferase n=1 Tax=Fischerella sp. PCC 9605 TaxID=1173024 RepID=UPI00047AE5BC|nr:glycosyltransferase [Fischerella sp. PCC 9605]
MKKVLLITTFLPNIGGGSVILRSLIPALKEKGIDVEWIYLTEKEVDFPEAKRLGEGLMGGKLLKDIVNSGLLWHGIKTPQLNSTINKILSLKADAYWVIGHSDGILIAKELARRTSIPVHLTIHDDLVGGWFGRTRRYRWLSKQAKKVFAEAMHAVNSVDVVSESMRRYYQQMLGVDSVVVHRYLPSLPKLESKPSEQNTLVVGHIGSIYSADEFRLFCQALENYGKQQKLSVKFIVIGADRRFLPTDFSELIVDIPQLTENEAIAKLAQCHFMYAMYPFDNAFAIFRQTSLPTKVTTYIQVQRPILAHTPTDSSLAEIVNTHRLGITTEALSVADLTEAIARICEYKLSDRAFELAHNGLFGMENVNRMVACLDKNA